MTTNDNTEKQLDHPMPKGARKAPPSGGPLHGCAHEKGAGAPARTYGRCSRFVSRNVSIPTTVGSGESDHGEERDEREPQIRRALAFIGRRWQEGVLQSAGGRHPES